MIPTARPHFRLRLIAEEPGQAVRLQAFRLVHPDMVVQPGQFATWEATITETDGQTAIVRHTLRELLDRLGEVLP